MGLACVLIHSKPGKASELYEDVKSLRGVKLAFEVLGEFDVVMEYEFRNLEQLGMIIYEIAKFPGVDSTETLIETVL